MFETESAAPGTQAPQIQESTELLVASPEKLGSSAFLKTTRKIGVAAKIIFVKFILADKSDTQGFDNRVSINAFHFRDCIESPSLRIPPLDVISKSRHLFIGQVCDRCFNLDLNYLWFTTFLSLFRGLLYGLGIFGSRNLICN